MNSSRQLTSGSNSLQSFAQFLRLFLTIDPSVPINLSKSTKALMLKRLVLQSFGKDMHPLVDILDMTAAWSDEPSY